MTPPPALALAACPLCGNKAFLTVDDGVWCTTDRCLTLPPRASPDEAITAWNTRHPALRTAPSREAVAEIIRNEVYLGVDGQLRGVEHAADRIIELFKEAHHAGE